MGGRDPEVSRSRRQQAERERGMTVIHAVMASILLLVLIQFLLLMVGVESFMAGHGATLLPSAIGSGLCFAACCGLVGYLAPSKERGPE